MIMMLFYVYSICFIDKYTINCSNIEGINFSCDGMYFNRVGLPKCLFYIHCVRFGDGHSVLFDDCYGVMDGFTFQKNFFRAGAKNDNSEKKYERTFHTLESFARKVLALGA